MRLLNVSTGRLEEYFGSAIPSYAILSHTWGLEEITFSDIQNIPENPRNLSTALAASYLQYPILEVGTREAELDAQALAPEPEPPQGPLFKNKNANDLESLKLKYTKVKRLCFEKEHELNELQTKLEKISRGNGELSSHFGSSAGWLEYVNRPDDYAEPRESGKSSPNGDITEIETLLPRYKRAKRVYFDLMAKIEHLQKAVNFPVIHDPSVQAKAGYQKIVYACRQAIKDGYQYIWIDTCCIDKSSSAELSEAINSMYDWYTQAGICYAYLEDVLLDNFSSSRWFTRGWTLQELLAPAHVTFFGKGWTRLGGKSDLANEISIATEIDWETLIYPGWLRKKSIAQRMCWASKRETTRLEDEAYCLFGIFGVKMPLLYGEGGNAFVRLQEEILKLSADQSLFAWRISPFVDTYQSGCGIFAPSPKNFEGSSSIVSFQRLAETAPYLMTNKGLQLDLPILVLSGYMVGLLDCQPQNDTSTCMAIFLQRTHKAGVCCRIQGKTVSEEHAAGGGLLAMTHEAAQAAIVERIYIPRDTYEVPVLRSTYQVQYQSLQDHGFQVVGTRPSFGQENVSWYPTAGSLHIVREMGASDISISFVFHDEDRKMAFAIYFDMFASTDSEGRLVEDNPIEVWMSPLVHEDSFLEYSKSTVYTVHNWLYALSYGLDHNGVALERHPALWFKHTDDTGVKATYGVSAKLAEVDHFDQKVRILQVDLSPTVEGVFGKGKFSNLGIWEPESLDTHWENYSLVKTTKFIKPPTENTTVPATLQPSIPTEESYGGLEVVPPWPFPMDQPDHVSDTRPLIIQILTKLVMLPNQSQKPWLLKSMNIRVLKAFELRSLVVGLQALQRRLGRTDPPPYFTPNSRFTRQPVKLRERQIIPQVLSRLVGQRFKK